MKLIKNPFKKRKVNYKKLEMPEFTSKSVPHDIFNELMTDKKSFIMKFPFDAYDCTIEFIKDAIFNKSIKEIYLSSYKMHRDSEITKLLIKARHLGKKVYIALEKDASGYSEENRDTLTLLQFHQCHIIDINPRYTVHAKFFLAIGINYESDLTYLSCISTGNFDETKAKTYTDIAYFTSDLAVGYDLERLFELFPKDNKSNTTWYDFISNNLYISPYSLRYMIMEEIKEQTILRDNGFILLKINQISDPKIIKALYNAAKSGVTIKILCSKALKIKSSKLIEVRNRLSALHDHDRIFVFGQNVYISSADLTERSMDKRIEIAIRIDSFEEKCKIMSGFEKEFNDTKFIWVLDEKKNKLKKYKEALK